tara:strand:+ start:1341 stop:2027 length:687 start_codon:yes stop_codon:yes gene_type:complete
MATVKPTYSDTKQYTPSDCAGFVYCTTNLINGKKYIGSKIASGKKPEFYLGSSVPLKRAVEKYGVSNFKREILEEVKLREDLDDAEVFWLNYFPIEGNYMFYNIKACGWGGDTFSGRSEEDRNRTREIHRQNATINNSASYIVTPEIIKASRHRMLTNNPMKLKTTEEIIKFNVQCQPVTITFKDGSKENYPSTSAAARGMGKSESTTKWRLRYKEDVMISGWKISKN